MSKRKSRLLGGQFGLANNALQAPPTIREESPSPKPSRQARKLSLETTEILSTSPTKHTSVGRKLSEQTIPTQPVIKVDPNLPGQRKISLDAALSGAPKIAPDGALVHQTKTPAERPSFLTTSVDSDTEDHEYFNIDPQSYFRESGQQRSTELQHKMGSPITSDSDVDTSSSWAAKSGLRGPSKQQQQQQLGNRSREVKSKVRQWEGRLSSDSEDSISSPTTSVTRRPIATPRAMKPALKPKPKLVGDQKVPPRPRMSQIDRARGKAGAVQKEEPHLQVEQQQPRMPSRPRGTEIRRARQAKQTTTSPISTSQTPTPPLSSNPTITATNYERGPVIPSSKNSAFKAINARRSPSPSRPGLEVVREERETEMTTSAVNGLRPANQRLRSRGKSPSRTPNSSVSSSLSPLNSLNTPRKDHNHTETDTPDATSSPSPAPSPLPGLAVGGDGNPLNQQMAETLIKYILASQDSGLKNALCECIMSNPEAVKALQK